MKQRFLRAALILICIILLLPVQVFANSPPPRRYYELQFRDLPEGTAYLDLLVYLPESDPFYTELEERNLPEGFSANAEIVTYCVDDFRSYTFHYQDAKSAIGVEGTASVLFFTDGSGLWENIRYDHMDDVEEKEEIRLAMLDEAGNILQVSQIFLLRPRMFLGSLEGEFVYNAAADTLEILEIFSGVGLLVYGFLAIVGLLLTCWVEWIVASAMGLWNKEYVLRVNVISQILMHTFYIAFYSLIFWRYTVALILLEVLVYAGEFVCYRYWLMRDLPVKKCLLFTVIANTASLVLGMLLLRLL